LGRTFQNPTDTLKSLDRFLCKQSKKYPDLNAAVFEAWCQTQEHLTSGVRRRRMQEVYKFCLYRRRTEPRGLGPAPALFPTSRQRLQPYICSQEDAAKAWRAASILTLV